MSTLSRDDVLKRIFTFKQLAAVVMGVMWGVVGLEGALALALFALAYCGSSFFFVTRVLGLDDRDVGHQSVLSEGFMPSASTFLLLWIFTYNLFHVAHAG